MRIWTLSLVIPLFFLVHIESHGGWRETLAQAEAMMKARIAYNNSRFRVRALDASTLGDKKRVERTAEVNIEDQKVAQAALVAQGEKEPQLREKNNTLKFLLRILNGARREPACEAVARENRYRISFLHLSLFLLSNGDDYKKSFKFMRDKDGAYWREIMCCVAPLLSTNKHLTGCLERVFTAKKRGTTIWTVNMDYTAELQRWEESIQEALESLPKGEKKKKKKATTLSKLRGLLAQDMQKLAGQLRRTLKKMRRSAEILNKTPQEDLPPATILKSIYDCLVSGVFPCINFLEDPKTVSLFRGLHERSCLINGLVATNDTEAMEKLLVSLAPPVVSASEGTGDESTSAAPADVHEDSSLQQEAAAAVAPVPPLVWNLDSLPDWAVKLAGDPEPALEEIVEGMKATFDPESSGVWETKRGTVFFNLPTGQPVYIYFHYPFGEAPTHPAWRFNFLEILQGIGCPCT